eukprot:2366491-Rhodomonas_salina.1
MRLFTAATLPCKDAESAAKNSQPRCTASLKFCGGGCEMGAQIPNIISHAIEDLSEASSLLATKVPPLLACHVICIT